MRVTAVPVGCGEAGAADAVTVAQVIDVTAYAEPGTNVSLQPRLLQEVPVEAASRTQSERRYVPVAIPVVFQLKIAVAE